MALRLHNGFVVKLQLLRHTRSGALDAGYNRSRLHMKDTIRTREFSIDDYEAAVELWKRVEGLEIAEGDDRHSVEEFLARNPELNRVAMDGELIVGVSLCGHDGRRGHIYHLAVDPAYQGLGLGKRLVEECFDGLRRAGIQRAIILVAKDNPRGREFWLRSGWEELPEAMAMGKDVATTAPS
jgi:ribosomal protein S18 acetylase RimI-like enzyme